MTTCSHQNFDSIKKLGADAWFDYMEPNCGEEIREHTMNNLENAFSTIFEGPSIAICADALSSTSGCKYSELLPIEFPRKNVESGSTIAYTALGEDLKFGPKEIPGNKEALEIAVIFWNLTEKLLAEGELKVHTPSVGKGGLGGMLDGLQALRENRVSGQKLVYTVG